MSNNLHERYPRTLYEWLKSDDKILLKAIADGESVLDVAETLGREHISVIRRMNALEVFCFEEHSEEWAEIMAMCLGGIPMCTAIEWCAAEPDCLPLEIIEGMAMNDLRTEMDLAREHRIIVANSDALADLSWLASQNADVKSCYADACKQLIDAYEVITPLTLKSLVEGSLRIRPAGDMALQAPASRPGGYGRASKRFHRKKSRPTGTTTRTVYAKRRSGRYRAKSSAR